MASYIQSILSKDEQVLYQAKVSPFSMFPFLLLAGVALLWSFFTSAALWSEASGWVFSWGLFWAAIWVLAGYLRYLSTELAITNKRVVAKFGFISRHTIELRLDKVESIQVRQGIVGRMFHFGSLVVAGAGTPQAPIPGISDPLAFRRMFVDIQESQSLSAV